MKRIISFLTVVAMLVATFAMLAVPATATTVDLTALDNKLASWWNFEGDTPYADKATGGNHSEALSPKNGATVENNVAIIPSDAGAHIQIPYQSSDFDSFNNKTLFIAYRITGTATGTSYLFASGNFYQYSFATGTTPSSMTITAKTWDNRGANTATHKKNITMATNTPKAIAEDGWYYVAMTASLVDGTHTLQFYNSADGTNYVLTEDITTGWVGNLNFNRVATLGKANTTATASGNGLGYELNEVRVYNEVLSADEISALAFNVPYATATPEPEEPEEPDVVPADGMFDEHLVAYYDFEGTTAVQQFADKAPNGETEDDLYFTSNVTVANGVAHVPQEQYEYISLESTSGDLASLVGKTIYIQFKAEGTAEAGVDLISSTSHFRYWLAGGSTAENYSFGGGIGSAPTKAGKLTSTAGPAAPATDWYYVAITIEDDGTELVVNVYNSADGSTYTKNVNRFESGAISNRTNPIVFGKAHAKVDPRGISYDFDEIRIYDTVLTEKQVAALSAIDRLPFTAVLGSQEKVNAETNLLDVRMVGHLNVSEGALKKFTEVGFVITAEYAGATKPEKTMASDTVYTSIVAGNEIITPAAFDYSTGYLFVLPIYNVPVEGTVTFTVKPYCVMNGEICYGETFTATYTDGVFVAA